MMYLLLDCESTGLETKDETTQVSIMKTDENFVVKKVYSFYCSITSEFSAGAIEKTGINHNVLNKLSNGKFLEDYLQEYYELFSAPDVVYIGYNVFYDLTLINNTLENNGYNRIDFGDEIAKLNVTSGRHYFDLMRFMSNMLWNGTNRNLEVATRLLGLTDEQLSKMFEKVLILCDQKRATKEKTFHDAVYDNFCVLGLLSKFRKEIKF